MCYYEHLCICSVLGSLPPLSDGWWAFLIVQRQCRYWNTLCEDIWVSRG